MPERKEIDRYFSREVKIVTFVLGLVSSLYLWVLRPIQSLQDETSSIKNNHLIHVQNSLDRIELDMRGEKEDDKKRDEALTRIETLLKSHIEK
jgi:hypothetical protein